MFQVVDSPIKAHVINPRKLDEFKVIYPSQVYFQPAYILVGLESGKIEATYEPNINGEMVVKDTMRKFVFDPTGVTLKAVKELMNNDILPLVQKILNYRHARTLDNSWRVNTSIMTDFEFEKFCHTYFRDDEYMDMIKILVSGLERD